MSRTLAPGEAALGLVRRGLEVVAALLPLPERTALVDRLLLDPARGTVLLLIVQLGVGSALWAAGFVSAQQARLERDAGAHTRAATAPSDAEIRQTYAPFYGGSEAWSPEMLRPFAYLWSPPALALEYGLVTGLLRGFHYVATRQALGDPLLSLVLGLGRGLRSRRRERQLRAALGPERADRFAREGEEAVIVSARPKPDWREGGFVRLAGDVLEIRAAGLVRDGRWSAFRYRLGPLRPGRIVRGAPLPYDIPGSRAVAAPGGDTVAGGATVVPVRPARDEPRQAATAAVPAEQGAGPASVAGAAVRTRWRVDTGEEARLTPDGPSAAIVESQGALPLRPRSEALGVHHRPEFPGSCVLLGGQRFEVVEEQPLETGFRYLLEPWPPEAVIRTTLSYGPTLVRAAQAERQRAVERERAQRWSLAVAPLVGLLPEERQILACDRLGLDPYVTTFAGAALEVAAGLGVALSIGAGPATLLLAELLGAAFVIPALLRLAGLLIAGEISGNWLLGALGDAFGVGSVARADATVLPLTRSAFWSRLTQPDRVERQADASLVFRGLLPHLTWGTELTHRVAGVPPRLRVGNDYWNVAPLETALERGRLVYAYHLWPARDENMLSDLPDPPPPDPRHYANEVLADVARQWDDLLRAFPWLPPLLPRAVQERAYRGRGGAAVARRWTLRSAAFFALVGSWMLLGRDPFSLVTAILLFVDAGQRVWRTLRGDYAPSILGSLLADYLRPERLAYQAHLEAERKTLRERARRG